MASTSSFLAVALVMAAVLLGGANTCHAARRLDELPPLPQVPLPGGIPNLPVPQVPELPMPQVPKLPVPMPELPNLPVPPVTQVPTLPQLPGVPGVPLPSAAVP
jgi:hypothetical protein